MTRLFYQFLSCLFLILTIILCVGLYVFLTFGTNLPNHTHLSHYEPPALSRFYTADTQLLHEHATQKRLFIPFSLIPQKIKDAFLAAEDRYFYQHFGIDFGGTARAIITNTLTANWQKRPGGASTITQQVAKNFLIGNKRSLERKVKEAILSLRLEYTLPKDRIFELYLNQIYLGSGAYGVAAAALIYFNKELNELSIEEAAFLAALPKAPSKFTRPDQLDRLKQRRNWIINTLVKDGKVSKQQGEKAKKTDISLHRYKETPINADYFIQEIKKILVEKIGSEKFQQGGLSIRTTLEPKLQQIADDALKTGLLAYDRRHGWRGPLAHLNISELPTNNFSTEKSKKQWLPLFIKQVKALGYIPKATSWKVALVLQSAQKEVVIGLMDGTTGTIPLSSCQWAAPCLPKQMIGPSPKSMVDVLKVGDVILVNDSTPHSQTKIFSLEQVPSITGGIVVLDPSSGRVLALTGGFDFPSNQFNSVTQAHRQIGSCFKPFVYLVGLEQGLTPESKLLDAPINISLGNGQKFYSPHNYNRQYLGPTPLSIGLIQSRNVMTIRLGQQVGMDSIIKIAKDFGIMEQMPKQIAMVLGAGTSTLLKLTSAYATLANNGIPIKPHFIDWVQDRYGNTIYTEDNHTNYHPPLASPQSISQLTAMMVGVTQQGTARSLSSLPFQIAGKTGTTNDFADAWFVGYTSNLVVGVFVGFAKPRTMGDGESGSRIAVPIARDFMEKAYADKEYPIFEDLEFSGIHNAANGLITLEDINEEPPYILEDIS